MAKISDWKVVATEGPTVDGRQITRESILEMAESYSTREYTAMIWPEHKRFNGYGPNWGMVTEVKAEEVDGKTCLFAKLQPNQLLLEANKFGQKLFTSIEPQPDYKNGGKDYLIGLAVTDSPASSGTSLLQFSRTEGEVTELQCSHLHEFTIDECYSNKERFFSMCKTFFSSGDALPETPKVDSHPEDEEPMNNEQFTQMIEKIDSISTKQEQLEEKQNQFSAQLENKAVDEPDKKESEPEAKAEVGVTAEQFSLLTKKLDGIAEQQTDLDNKFSLLSEEKPGQDLGQGGDETTVEVV
ncbi:GPO family capsid scaffolding protein [Vibrio amylolyticus]|uniref:GPO family capsid scaffolding protein n=1 Tax=Vibrio amylolyticus TaxID=2847292 RepID=UPI003551C04D